MSEDEVVILKNLEINYMYFLNKSMENVDEQFLCLINNNVFHNVFTI